MLKAPISLMTVYHGDVCDRVHARYPFFVSSLEERRRLFGARVPAFGFAEAS